MITQQTIAVIGATTDFGKALCIGIAGGNYSLLLYEKIAGEMLPLIVTIKKQHPDAMVETVPCSVNAGWEADIIFIDIDTGMEKLMLEELKEVANQKIVISTGHTFYDKETGLPGIDGLNEITAIQELMPFSKVVKVFKTEMFPIHSTDLVTDKNNTTLLAGSDRDALQKVFGIMAKAGFNSVVAGNISVSRTLENLQLLHNWMDPDDI